jgi:hypothetical protein
MDDYGVVLDPVIGLFGFIALDVAVPFGAMLYSSKLGTWKWPAHVGAFLFVLASPILYFILTTPTLPPDEAPGPGDGILVMPLLGVAAISGLLYLMFFLFTILGWVQEHFQTAKAGREKA